MKVAIISEASSGVAWEQHLRPHSIVRQVELRPTLGDVGKVDACFILDSSPQNIDLLLEAVRRGLNCFFIAKQPTNIEKLEKIHRASRESGCIVQFAQWPSLAPATRWMMDKIQKPRFIHIEKDVIRNQLTPISTEFQHLWIDELGLSMKWINSGIHHIEANKISLSETQPVLAHLFLRFDNGTTVTININASATENRHKRIIGGKSEILECNVPDQTVKLGKLSNSDHIYFEKLTFDPSKAAERAALLFLKSIQLNKESGYTSYDALQLAIQVDRIALRLSQFS